MKIQFPHILVEIIHTNEMTELFIFLRGVNKQ